MLGFRKLRFVQAKLYLREPMAAFFTLLFGPSLLILLGFTFGNDPDPMLSDLGFLDSIRCETRAMLHRPSRLAADHNPP